MSEYYIKPRSVASGATARAEEMNDTRTAAEQGFDAVENDVRRRLAVHQGADHGSLEIPAKTLENSMIKFNEHGDLDVHPIGDFDVGIRQVAEDRVAVAQMRAEVESDRAEVSANTAVVAEIKQAAERSLILSLAGI